MQLPQHNYTANKENKGVEEKLCPGPFLFSFLKLHKDMYNFS